MALMHTVPRCIGHSRDHRTNRWWVSCPACGHGFEPRTTMLRSQELDCPKCRVSMVALYTEEPRVDVIPATLPRMLQK